MIKESFLISKIDPTTINWSRNYSKYTPIEEKLSSLKVGEAIKVENLEYATAPTYIVQKTYIKVKGNYRIKTHYNKDKKTAYFYKIDR